MARRVREVIYDDDDDPMTSRPAPVRRVITERHVGGGGYGWGMNPATTVVAIVLALFILLLILGVAR
ncbi:MAG: hypothetical protein JF603_09660 [Acidobacteria bacterium]|nr:hypothetical protein [Acidobacteriota bacterium]